jgi:enoyl-CoA hydratase/carnithine racemase
MSDVDSLVLAERRGSVLLLTFNRPDRLNAWTDELEDVYFDLLLEADDDDQVGAIVVTGAGRGFCAGADLAMLDAAADPNSESTSKRRSRDLPTTIRKPVVAAVNGVAVGLGLVEAMYCDVVFSAPEAKFGAVFAKRGLIAEYGLAWMLPRMVGTANARDLLLSARLFDGTEAHAMGLVSHLREPGDLVSAAVDYGAAIARDCAPRSIATIKTQLSWSAQQTYREAYELAEPLMLQAFRAPDAVEGVASFREKRDPNFLPLPPRGDEQ